MQWAASISTPVLDGSEVRYDMASMWPVEGRYIRSIGSLGFISARIRALGCESRMKLQYSRKRRNEATASFDSRTYVPSRAGQSTSLSVPRIFMISSERFARSNAFCRERGLLEVKL